MRRPRALKWKYLRVASCPPSDVLARYGGEEFVVVAPETDLESAEELSERIRTTLLLTDMRLMTQELRITASFGVAMLQDDDDSPEALLTRADQALYAAKRSGRNRIVIDARISEVRDAV